MPLVLCLNICTFRQTFFSPPDRTPTLVSCATRSYESLTERGPVTLVQHHLQTQPTRTVLAQRGFTSAAPEISNSLPEDLRNCCTLETFRRKLKTRPFNCAFSA